MLPVIVPETAVRAVVPSNVAVTCASACAPSVITILPVTALAKVADEFSPELSPPKIVIVVACTVFVKSAAESSVALPIVIDPKPFVAPTVPAKDLTSAPSAFKIPSPSESESKLKAIAEYQLLVQ